MRKLHSVTRSLDTSRFDTLLLGIFNSEVPKDLWAAFPVEVGVDIP